MAERAVRLNVTSKEPYYAQVQGEDTRRKLSVRLPRAMAAYHKLQRELGSSKVALIPPSKVRERVALQQKEKQARLKAK